MLEKQPDIVRQRALMKRGGDDRIRRRTWPGPTGNKNSFGKSSIRRPIRLPGSSWKSTPTTSSSRLASRLRAAAALRLESQRVYYDEGRITIDRFLDAVSQYATAVATEAQYKTAYNISIVALEEAKGTLLEHEQITVVEGPKRSAGPTMADETSRVAASRATTLRSSSHHLTPIDPLPRHPFTRSSRQQRQAKSRTRSPKPVARRCRFTSRLGSVLTRSRSAGRSPSGRSHR